MASTVDISSIISELGGYVTDNTNEIVGAILRNSNIDPYCTSKGNVRGTYAMLQAEFDEISQPFQKAWTPKGTLTFNPNTIVMRRVKADFEFVPDDIYNEWITNMFEEGKNRADQPISKFIVMKMIEKMKEERGITAIDGVYTAATPGTAGTRVQMFDGFKKLLADIQTAGSGNEVTTGVITGNEFSKTLDFFRTMKPEERAACGNLIFASKAVVDAVFDDYESNNPNKSLTAVGGDQYGYVIPGTQGGKIVGIDGMGTSQRLWATPKWNQLKLYDTIESLGNIEVQLDKRQVLLLTDYAVAYGFGFNQFVWHNDQA